MQTFTPPFWTSCNAGGTSRCPLLNPLVKQLAIRLSTMKPCKSLVIPRAGEEANVRSNLWFLRECYLAPVYCTGEFAEHLSPCGEWASDDCKWVDFILIWRGCQILYSFWHFVRIKISEIINKSHAKAARKFDSTDHGGKKFVAVRGTEITKVPIMSLDRRVDKRSASTIFGHRWMRYAYPPYI